MSQEKIKELILERARIEPEFRAIQQDIEKQVQEKLDGAGLSTLLTEARAVLEKHRIRLQSKADNLTGQIEALESVFGAIEAPASAEASAEEAPVAEA